MWKGVLTSLRLAKAAIKNPLKGRHELSLPEPSRERLGSVFQYDLTPLIIVRNSRQMHALFREQLVHLLRLHQHFLWLQM